MAYDEKLADRMRMALEPRRTSEVKMFGGLCFMLNGNMLCGLGWEGYMFRVGEAQHAAALKKGAKPMMMRDRAMPGFVWIDPDKLDKRALASWIAMAEAYVGPLPPKAKKKKPAKKALAKRRA